MSALDDFDADLLETEKAIRQLEEQLQGLAKPRKTEEKLHLGKKGDVERVPGRWCRGGDVPRWRPIAPGRRGKVESSRSTTFGSAARWRPHQESEGDFLLNPVDDALSTTPVVKGAKIHRDTVKPRQILEAKKWLETVAEKSHCQEASKILQAGSLSAVTAAWQVLLDKERREQQFGDDASTDAGSDLPELLSVSSAASSLPPGPGSYSPNFEVSRPSLAKGAPSFARYSARERPQEEDEPQDTLDETTDFPALAGSTDEPAGFTCPGGKILPPHNTRPRRPTTSELDALCSARRPLGTLAPEPPAPAPALFRDTDEAEDVWTRHPATGRLERLEKMDPGHPGPGDYDLPALPGGPTPIIAPPSEPCVKEEVVVPGPTQYDLRASEALVYPRTPGGNFAVPRPDVMEHQRGPDYAANYDALELNFDQVESRAPNALILPEESEEALQALRIMKHRAPAAGTGVQVGPGTYQEDDGILQRIRPDRMVLPWYPRREGVAEHLVGLHKHYTRFGRWRLDDRALLGVDDDLALRRNRPRAFIQPPHAPPLKRSWSAEDIWRLYLPELDEPQGRSFARNLDFDDWQEKEKQWRWLAVRHFCRTRPSLRLCYSLPDLELVKDRAPEVDFSKAPGRSPRAMEEEEVEGDILLLDTDAGHELRYPRAVSAVDMSKQLGRDDGNDVVDDFEELVLSPKRPLKRPSCFVDMAKEPGRPAEPAWDPHIWAEEPDRVFCYHPTTSFETEDVLDLSVASAQRRLQRRVPTYDWALCMGRPGHDVRVEDEESPPESALLTNWEAPFVAPAIPGDPRSSSGPLELPSLPDAPPDPPPDPPHVAELP